MNQQNAGQFHSRDRSFKYATALPCYWNWLNESVTVENELPKGAIEASISFAGHFGDHNHERGPLSSDASSSLDKLSYPKRKRKHHHYIEAIDVNTMRHH
jgi:hypothetical protein